MDINFLTWIVSDDTEIVCPHCNHNHDVDDLWDYIDMKDDSCTQEFNCFECNKAIYVDVLLTIKFEVSKETDND